MENLHTFSGMDAAFAWLNGLSSLGIKLGLDRVEAVLSRLQNPHKSLRVVTVAGTNGKGSTASFLASILYEAGYRVGLYTSPHLLRVNERFSVGKQPISDEDLLRWLMRVKLAMEASPGISLTYFEVLTVLAFLYFQERQVDLAIMEVGLGGRLDATNVADAEVAILTRVGLDHQEYLGNSKALIAREKVAIVKEGSTLISGVSPRLWHEVVGPYCQARRVVGRRAGIDFRYSFHESGYRFRSACFTLGGVRLGLLGQHQGLNAALAAAAAEALFLRGFHMTASQIALGLSRARIRGRMERLKLPEGPMLLLDGAHNPMAMQVLSRQLESLLPERPRVALFGLNPTKNVRRMLRQIEPQVDHMVLSASGFRPVKDFDAYTRLLRGPFTVEKEPEKALHRAMTLAGEDGGVCLTGSLYFMGDVLPFVEEWLR